MSATQPPTPATDFWSALGVGNDTLDRNETPDHQASPAAGTAADPEAEPSEQAELDLEATVRDWASMFTGDDGPPEDDTAEAEEVTPAAQDEDTGPDPEPHVLAEAPETEPSDELLWPPRSPSPPSPSPAEEERSVAAVAQRAPEAPQVHADPAETRILLANGQSFRHLWLDERVDEVHIRGTQVSVCGTLGVYQVPGFGSLTMAHRAIAAVREEAGAVVTQIGDSVVLRRSRRTGPALPTLVAAGVVTDDQLAEVRTALERTQAVVLTGPAAPVIMRSFTALLPKGSRVFEGPYAALPAWCVAAESPLDADYVVGVRPGAPAEEMAAMGQIGALIANPETAFEAAVRFGVQGRSAAPEKLTSGHPHR
ncbi:hypothetical protein [Actinoallomurus iriomotensis]|uniref:Uncharacterized protein n=1 Tax=Actinoallomurus iriomotensis TaxID=478107 RepID=A0A9W6RRH3_9ACTN|nr:hypothetical protein [Actinoallomurus iriomotensis]GLY80433.1 hypothetical protein Airi01_087000 [Actinoallomurus iriomotensis]